MRMPIIRLLVLIPALAGVMLLFGISGEQAGHAAARSIDWNERQIRWHSYEDGLQEAERTGRPVLAVVYADWCPHCAAYSRLFSDPEVVRLARNLVMVKLNGEQYPEVSARYAPDGGYVPRTLVLRPDGKLIPFIHGDQQQYRYFLNYQDTQELLDVMKRALAAGENWH